MRKFLLKTGLFFLFSLLLLTVTIIGIYFIVSSASFSISEEKDILVIGDSHPECAIDDSIFLRSFNASQSGTPYLYSYVKLEKFLKVNPHINTVFISFHNGAISKGMDELIMNDTNITNSISQYVFLFSTEELAIFYRKLAFYSALIKFSENYAIKAIPKFILNHSLTFKDLFIGKYVYLDRNRLQEAIKLAEDKIITKIDTAEVEYSEYQHRYLQKIIELCYEKGVEPVLFNTPTYMPEKYGNKSSLENYYNMYFSNVTYLDYSDFPLPDYGYGDIEHLNYKGASIFSQWLEDNYTSSILQISGIIIPPAL